MNENLLADLSAWLTQAGLAGTPETDIVSVFCERCNAAGVPLARAVIFVDTLHPVHEGRLFRWAMVPMNHLYLNMAEPARTHSLRRALTPSIWNKHGAGAVAPTTRWCKLAIRCCAAP